MTIRFSIVIPTFDRGESLRGSLDSLAALEYAGGDFEVVIVDDGGSRAAEEFAAPYRERLALAVHRQRNSGPAAARNTGARLARGRYLAFLDDDCTVVPGWLSAFDRAFETHGENCLLGGWTLNPHPDRVLPMVSDLILGVIRRQYRPVPGGIYFFGGANLAAPAAAFQRFGGFDVAFDTAEDRELCDRWLHRGGTLVDVPAAVAWHADNLDLPRFVQRYVNYGRGAYWFHRLRRQRGSGRWQADFALFYLRVLRACAASPRPFLTSAVWATWQVANATGFASELVANALRPSSASRRPRRGADFP